MVRFLSLSSGSNGNCYFIGNEAAGILIDVGIGGRTIKKRLAENGISISDISLVLVSHDHFDHIRSLGTFYERFHIPVYATKECIRAFERHYCTKGYLTGACRAIAPGQPEELCSGNIRITAFRVPHDATDTVGYHIEFFGEKFTFMTDIGAVTDDAVEYASKADHLIVEANYDLDMLIHGPYTPDLKHRIMNGHGHLSNEQTASLVTRALAGGTIRDIFLCHLSENNNTHEKALSEVEKAVPKGFPLYALPRREASRLFCWQTENYFLASKRLV